MSIGLIVNVKDQPDLLADNIAHHKKVGVRDILVADRSIDESMQKQIAEVGAQPGVSVFNQNVTKYQVDSDKFHRRRDEIFETFCERFDADWIGVLDVDEYYLPRNGSFASVESLKQFENLSIPRFNIALASPTPLFFADSPGIDSMLDQPFVKEPTRITQEFLRENPNFPMVRAQVGPKPMTKHRDIEVVPPGFHTFTPKARVKTHIPSDLVVLHVPFTTLERFQAKVQSIRAHFELIKDGWGVSHGWHWRRLGEMTDEEVVSEFERQLFSEEEIERLLDSGVLQTPRALFASATNVRPVTPPRQSFIEKAIERFFR